MYQYLNKVKQREKRGGKKLPASTFTFATANRRSTYLGGVIFFWLNEIGVIPIIEHPTAKNKKIFRHGYQLLPQNKVILKSAAARESVYFSTPLLSPTHHHHHSTYHTCTPHTHTHCRRGEGPSLWFPTRSRVSSSILFPRLRITILWLWSIIPLSNI